MLDKGFTISSLQAGYKRGDYSVDQIMERVVQRADETSEYNVWVVPPSLEAILDQVQAVQARLEAGAELPLYGIPFAVKDNIDVAGMPTTAGCPGYTYVPSEHATVVQLLIEAGAILVGKTNLDQFATGLVGTRSLYGECHNALRPDLISGGSSSGSAVAVALGMAAFALGTDTAGSGRVPAALNNLIGFKPPLGSWSTKGVVPACASLDCVTVFAHTLDDAECVDDIVAGYDPDCIWSKRYQRMTEGLPERVLVPANTPQFYGAFGSLYHSAWDEACDVVQQAAQSEGLECERYDTTLLSDAAEVLYGGPWVAERWADLGDFVESHPGATLPVTETILRSGAKPAYTAASVFKASHFLQKIRHITNEELDNAVLILPTCGGTFTRDEVRNDPIQTNSLMGLYTNHCNLLDMVALAIPMGFADRDLPFGITLFAPAKRQNYVEGVARLLLDAQK